MKKILIIFLFITACGFEPIYINKNIISFNEINLIGDERINRKINSILLLNNDSNSQPTKKIFVESRKSIIEASKDPKGQTATYKSTVEIKVVISNDEEVEKQRIFDESFTYNNLENKYNLYSYQKKIEDDLVNKIIEDLIIFINLQ
tara:strand:- start:1161 stop:1601 length:441 start_codon:yes stop_codon:yes gene_type:complete